MNQRTNRIIFFCCYILFIISASLTFMVIERQYEQEPLTYLIHQQQSFYLKYPGVDADDLRRLIESVIDATNRGIQVPILKSPSDFIIENDQDRHERPIGRSHHHHQEKSENQKRVAQLNSGAKTSMSKDEILKQKSPNRDETIHPSTTEVTRSKIVVTLSNGTIIPEDQQDQDLNNSSSTHTARWRFTSSMLFITSIVTTIGYGNISPLTNAGKFVSIMFAIVGIPATLILFSTTVTLLLRGPVNWLELYLVDWVSLLKKNLSLFTIRVLHLVLITMLMLLVCFFLPAVMFYFLEQPSQWSYLDSFYYCFISLTTIGLGDLIPGSMQNFISADLYRLVVVIYLYCGVCCIMLWLALIYRIPEFNIYKYLIRAHDEYVDETDQKIQILNEKTKLYSKDQRNYTLFM